MMKHILGSFHILPSQQFFNSAPPPRVGQKNQKCANQFHKYLMWCSITQGLLEQRGSIMKKVHFQDVPNYTMWVL